MEFHNPTFLWALFALAIPLLIHLFHFRRYKTLVFPNVRFLREVKQERNNIRNLKRWLLLATRMLALLFLVAAFARPYLKGEEASERGRNAVSIFLDNSFSMSLEHKGVPLLEWGRDRAREVVEAYSEEDEFQILTNDMKVEELRWKSKQDALNYLDKVDVSNASLMLQTVTTKQDFLFERSNSDNLRSYLISDFQENMLDGAELNVDSTSSTYLFHLASDDVKNIYIDSIWMSNPVNVSGSGNQVLYRVTNSSELDASEVRIALRLNDQVQSVRELNLLAGEVRTDTLFFNIYKEGWQLAEIRLEDYPITMDDVFYFSFEAAARKDVLEVYSNSGNNIIRRIFEKDNYIRFSRESVGRLNYSAFEDHDLIVLNELTEISAGLTNSLLPYVKGGGNVLLIPSATADPSIYANLLGTLASASLGAVREGSFTMARPDLRNAILQNIVERLPSNTTLPRVSKYYPVNTETRRIEQKILALNNNDGLLVWFPNGNGNLFIQTVPSRSDYSDLINNWFYAPVVYNLALFHGLGDRLYGISGKDEWIELEAELERKDNVVMLTGEDMEFIPEQRVANNRLVINSARSELVPAGHYRAHINEQTLGYVSYNTNRRESTMKFPQTEDLRTLFPEASEVVSGLEQTLVSSMRARNEGRPLWRTCLILALLFLIAEVAVIKWLPD